MTGPEHYRRAEELICDPSTYNNVERAGVLLAMAQVHATLALAAATAGDSATWQQAINGPRPVRHGRPRTELRPGCLREERAQRQREQGVNPSRTGKDQRDYAFRLRRPDPPQRGQFRQARPVGDLRRPVPRHFRQVLYDQNCRAAR
jgi:hypothetical protein